MHCIEDCIDSLPDASGFRTLNAISGYWQAPISPSHEGNRTLPSHLRTNRYSHIPFRLPNDHDIILSGAPSRTCLSYLDDIVISSQNTKDHINHINHIDNVLGLIWNAGVRRKLK